MPCWFFCGPRAVRLKSHVTTIGSSAIKSDAQTENLTSFSNLMSFHVSVITIVVSLITSYVSCVHSESLYDKSHQLLSLNTRTRKMWTCTDRVQVVSWLLLLHSIRQVTVIEKCCSNGGGICTQLLRTWFVDFRGYHMVGVI